MIVGEFDVDDDDDHGLDDLFHKIVSLSQCMLVLQCEYEWMLKNNYISIPFWVNTQFFFVAQQ